MAGFILDLYMKTKTNIEKECEICRSKFFVFKSRDHTAKVCSKKCLGSMLSSKPNTECANCKKEFYIKPSRKKNPGPLGFFCSHSCHGSFKSEAYKGYRNPNFRNAIRDQDGYLFYTQQASLSIGEISLVRMKMHQAVYCELFGVTKTPNGLHIHHKDCDPLNNSPSNLVLMTAKDHRWLHAQYGSCALWAIEHGKLSIEDALSWSNDIPRAERLICQNLITQSATAKHFKITDFPLLTANQIWIRANFTVVDKFNSNPSVHAGIHHL